MTPTSAVLDQAHVGDIHGAFGTIRLSDVNPRRTWRRRLLTLAAIIGPGIIVMVGDNDAGGVSTYAQGGQNFGYSLLWTLVLLIPVLIVNQEMVVRLGAVTGVGHARLINERFGRFWGWFSVGDLFILNFLTIVTEFIGIGYSAEYFGFSQYVVVPLAALTLIGITLTGNFRRWERAMFVFVTASLLVFPLVFLSHPDPGAALKGFVRTRASRVGDADIDPADHCDRRNHGCSVAAFLSAVERDRQADHTALARLRESGHDDRSIRGRDRRGLHHDGVRFGIQRNHRFWDTSTMRLTAGDRSKDARGSARRCDLRSPAL